MGEVVHNDEAYYKFVIGVFNARIGKANESGYEKITITEHGSLLTGRLMQKSTIF